jgi:hypothetical protein
VSAPADERILTVGEYLGGAVLLSLIVAPMAWGAWRVRGRFMPGWEGAPARLAEAVLTAAGLIWLAEILGTFGWFGEWQMLVAALGGGIGAGLAAGPERGEGPVPPAPFPGTIAKWLAALACAAVAAGWMVPTLSSLAGGMDRADTLWYHMPLAARFVQTGSLDQIFYFDPIFFASFYPSNSEIFHAVPILTFHRDILSPLINIGWLSVGLLASWCIGRPYGLAPQALLGGAIALGAQMLVEFQAGEALNDITGVVFVLAAVALLVNGYAARRVTAAGALTDPPADAAAGVEAGAVTGRLIAAGPLVVAGIAAGVAAGIKLSFLAPVAALTLGVIAITPRGSRRRVALVWTLPLVAAGAYWYLRNLAAVGNPIPFVASLGPIDLPAPDRDFELRPDFAVIHYWNDFDVWKDWFIPGLDESFGLLWPLTLGGMVGGAALAAWRGREPVLRMLGAVVLFTTLAYVFTPLTAAGEEGEPIAFVWNVRYIAPAAAVGLAILPCIPALRATPQRRAVVTAALGILLAVTVGSLVQWKQGHAKGALAAGVLVFCGFAIAAWLRSRGLTWAGGRRRLTLALAAGALVLVVAGGYAEQRHYLEHRYENTSPTLKLAAALRFPRDLRDQRIAIGGIRGVFNQYPFYGTDLSNHVQWLGIKGPNDAWLRIPTCWQWRTEINEGDYDYVVTTYDPFNPGRLTNTKEAVWTRRDPGVTQVLRDGPVAIFKVNRELNPAGCAGLPRLSAAELNGESVNARPLANQPPGTGPRHNGATRSNGREKRRVLRRVQRRAERKD